MSSSRPHTAGKGSRPTHRLLFRSDEVRVVFMYSVCCFLPGSSVRSMDSSQDHIIPQAPRSPCCILKTIHSRITIGTSDMPTSYQLWVWEREAHINWSMVTCQGSTRYWNYLEDYWPCAGGLSAVNAIGTQLHEPINSGLTRWRMAV